MFWLRLCRGFIAPTYQQAESDAPGKCDSLSFRQKLSEAGLPILAEPHLLMLR
jgi:hypothetical protein